MLIRSILPKLLSCVTRTPRYRPRIVWSDGSLTHNIFRVYEIIFWRKVGIRAEMRSFFDIEKNQVYYEVYTFEAYCAHIETIIREKLKYRFGLKKYRLVIQEVKFANNPYGYKIPMASFAIAHDATSTFGTAGGDTTSPTDWSHTTSGSDRTLVLGTHSSSSNNSIASVSSASYNSVAMTKTRADSNTTTFASESSIWMLGSPATGANTVSFSWSGGLAAKAYGGAISYTGTAASSTADAHNGTNGTGTGAKSVTVTTVADNCWVMSVMTNAGSTSTLTPTQTSRWNNTTAVNQAKCGGSDTNGPKTPAGGQAMTWTVGTLGTNHALSGASIAPAVALAATKRYTLTTLGVG